MEIVPSLGEIIGYIASGLVFLTFCMKTMMPLRLVAIGSNVAFIAYGAFNSLFPILVLHSLLLPLNIFRTNQIWQLIRTSDDAENTELNIEDLFPYMTDEKFRADEMVFRKGDVSDKLYYIAEGKIGIEEYGAELETGSLFGEIGIFSDDKIRTASARCLTHCKLLSLTEKQVRELYFQNPKFGYFVIRLMARRLIRNVRELEKTS